MCCQVTRFERYDWLEVTWLALRPIIHKLLNTHLAPNVSDSELAKSMKKILSDDLSRRYTGDVLQVLTKACFLDPHFNSLKFLPDDSRKDVIVNLKLDVSLIHPVDHESSPTSLEPPTKWSKGEHKLLEFLEEMTETAKVTETCSSMEEQLDLEIQCVLL